METNNCGRMGNVVHKKKKKKKSGKLGDHFNFLPQLFKKVFEICYFYLISPTCV